MKQREASETHEKRHEVSIRSIGPPKSIPPTLHGSVRAGHPSQDLHSYWVQQGMPAYRATSQGRVASQSYTSCTHLRWVIVGPKSSHRA